MASLRPVYTWTVMKSLLPTLMVLLPATTIFELSEAWALGEPSSTRMDETTDDGLLALASSDSPSTPEDSCSLNGCVLQDLDLLEDYVLSLNRALTNEDMFDEVNNTWCDAEVNQVPFGALASDWSRLLLLQQTQPADSNLRDNLLRLSRLLVVAYFQDNVQNSTDANSEFTDGPGDESDESSATTTRPSLEAESPAQQASNVTTLGSTARNESSRISEPDQVRSLSLDDVDEDDFGQDYDDASTTASNSNDSFANSSTSGADNESVESTASTLGDGQTVAPSPRDETIERLLASGESNSSNNEALHDRSKEDFVSSRKNLDPEDLQVAKFFESDDEEAKPSRDSSEGSQLTASMEELLEIASKQAESGTDSSLEATTEDGMSVTNSNLTDGQTTNDTEAAVTSNSLKDLSADDEGNFANDINVEENAETQGNDTDDDLDRLVDEAGNLTDGLETFTIGNGVDGSPSTLNDLITETDDSTSELDSVEEFFSRTGDDVNETSSILNHKFSGGSSTLLDDSTTSKTNATEPKLDSIEEFFRSTNDNSSETTNLDDESSVSLEEANIADINVDEVTDKADSSEQNDDSNMSFSIEELIKQLDQANGTAQSSEDGNVTKSIEKFFQESEADIDSIKLPTDETRADELTGSSEPVAASTQAQSDKSSSTASSLSSTSSSDNGVLNTGSSDSESSSVESTDLPQLKVIFNESSGDTSNSIPDQSGDTSNPPNFDDLEGMSVEKNDQAQLDSGSVDGLLAMGADSSTNAALPNLDKEPKPNSDDGKNVWWPSLAPPRGTSSQESNVARETESNSKTEDQEQEPVPT